MLVESIFLALLIGVARGYKVRNLESIHLNKVYLLFISFLIELVLSLILRYNVYPFTSFVSKNYFILHLSIYLFIFFFFICNFHYRYLRVIILGITLNFIVIILNNGLMPVSIDMAINHNYTESIDLLKNGYIAGHTVLNKETTPLWILGDIINIPHPYPFPQTISIGDVIISIGMFLFIQNNIKKTKIKA